MTPRTQWRRRPRWKHSAAGGALALAALISVSGCSTETTYHASAVEMLQERVLHATTAAGAADYALVLKHLDTLEAELHDALARGHITRARFDAVMAAIRLVRSEIENAIEEQSDDASEPDSGTGPNTDRTEGTTEIPPGQSVPVTPPEPQDPGTRGNNGNNNNGNNNSGNNNSDNGNSGNSGNSGNRGRGNGPP